jgi:predicted AAA+ superfamily ATPase
VDPGVVRAVKRARGPATAEESGALLEGWVYTLLRTYMAERELGDELAYWAPAESAGVEVDFLLRRGHDLCALEVKATSRFQRHQLAGLRAVAGLPELRRRVLIYRGDRALRTEDGIDVWPVSAFLEALSAGGLWP